LSIVLENEFSVAVPVDRAWTTLLDVERVAPCMPGATLTSWDGSEFTGNVKVRLGPVSLTYAGKGRLASRDDGAKRVVIEASGKDSRGAGTAAATVTAALSPDGDGTRVHVVTDLHITGQAAQFARGMANDVAGRLVKQFADCLATTIAQSPPMAAATVDSAVNGAILTPAPGTAADALGIPDQAAASTPPAPQEVRPIDLLEVSGARRLLPYALVALALVVIGVLAILYIR
jgi:carbon monoxide dehydrogenase subunit G